MPRTVQVPLVPKRVVSRAEADRRAHSRICVEQRSSGAPGLAIAEGGSARSSARIRSVCDGHAVRRWRRWRAHRMERGCNGSVGCARARSIRSLTSLARSGAWCGLKGSAVYPLHAGARAARDRWHDDGWTGAAMHGARLSSASSSAGLGHQCAARRVRLEGKLALV